MLAALRVIFSFSLLFSLFAFSLLMGVLLFFRLQRFHLLAHVLGTLLPLALFVFFSWLILIYKFYRAHPDERCGGPLMGAFGIIALGAVVLAVMSPFAQGLLHAKSTGCGNQTPS
jgi:CDP-diglyceride synthetase